MKTLWKTLIYPFQMIWDSIFDNDAGKIVSKQGQEGFTKKGGAGIGLLTTINKVELTYFLLLYL